MVLTPPSMVKGNAPIPNEKSMPSAPIPYRIIKGGKERVSNREIHEALFVHRFVLLLLHADRLASEEPCL